MAANPNWEALSVQIPGEDLLEKVRNILETLMVYLEVLKTILETVEAFLVDFGNPIKALVEALIQLILQLFNSLKRTGIYGWYDVPNPLVDPNFNLHVGGFEAFVTRFKASLYDSRDSNRPQPIPGATKSGFTLIVADAEDVLGLLRKMQILLRFFGKEFLTPQYAPPANFKVLPLGANGDPILSLAKLFQDQPKSVVVEWSLPPVSSPGDPGFSDLIQAFSINFVPPKFLIEKSAVNPAVGEVDISNLSDVDATGMVTASVPTKFEARGQPGATIKRSIQLMDQNNDPIFKFQKYIVVDTSHATSTFLLGQLGTFRYIDTDVQVNNTYYYRVRAFSGSLDVKPDNTMVFPQPTVSPIDQVPYIQWPASDTTDPPVMGKSSPTAPIRIPTYPAKFDVIENLNRLFQTAFSLNFHLPLPKGDKFDSAGLAVDPTPNSDIGKGSLTSLAGPLTSFQAAPLVGDTVSSALAVTAKFQRDPVTGQLPSAPWNESQVQRNAARLATIVAGAMLEANSAVAFKALMQGPYPSGTPTGTGLTATTIEQMVFEITKVQDPEAAGQGAVQAAGVLYGNVFADPHVRLNTLAAVNFCKAFTLGGAPPDWIQISFLRDIVPWSGQLLYDLLAKMQALLDAYRGVLDEIKSFIDLIIRKIDTLEAFLQYLVSILDFIEGLSLGFFILSVPETDGDVSEWASLVDNAGGTKPPSGPGGYSAGVALAYVAPDVTAFADAFSLIF